MESTDKDVSVAQEPEAPSAQARQLTALRADRVINQYMLGSMGVGLLPLPLVDLVALTALQLRMLDKLSDVYGVDFSQNLARKIISSLIGGAVPVVAAMPLASMLRAIPVIGWGLGSGSMSFLAGATTYATGRVFMRHFGDGGTLLDLDPEKAAEYFKEQYEEGKKKVASLKADAKSA